MRVPLEPQLVVLPKGAHGDCGVVIQGGTGALVHDLVTFYLHNLEAAGINLNSKYFNFTAKYFWYVIVPKMRRQHQSDAPARPPS